MFEDRVAAGAAWLDEKYPGWEDKIDLGLLNIARADTCVLGQLGLGDQYFNLAGRTNTAFLIEHGFDRVFGEPDLNRKLDELTYAWRLLIRGRRLERMLVDA